MSPPKMSLKIGFPRKHYRLRLPARALLLGPRTLVMGVLNVTPDSFSDGGVYLDTAQAIARALELQAAGADILDIGAESTRPGAEPLKAGEELARILPVLEGLRGQIRVPISIDTTKATVAEAGITGGAEIINTAFGPRTDPELLKVIRHKKVAVVLMHMRGTPATMQRGPFARDILADVTAGLRQAAREAARAGIPRSKILLDPGIGFVGKRCAVQNFRAPGARLPRTGLPQGFPAMKSAHRARHLLAGLCAARATQHGPSKSASGVPPPRWPPPLWPARTSCAFTTSPKWPRSRA